MSLHLKNFIDVTRLNKPIGFLLLFWPCTWGLSLAYYFYRDVDIFVYYLFLFFCGSVLMRSAGCIVNDIVDEKIDRKVFRTKKKADCLWIAKQKLGLDLCINIVPSSFCRLNSTKFINHISWNLFNDICV